MKIVNHPADALRAAQKTEAVARGRGVNGPDRARRDERVDRVNLSPVAAELADGEVTENPATDEARLHALRQAVLEGTLEVDDEALAQSIADEDLAWPAADKLVNT